MFLHSTSGSPDTSAPDTTAPDTSSPDTGAPGTSADLYEFVWFGLTKDEAIAKAEADGTTYRIGREDDETFALTEDFQEGRVTWSIDDGVVTYSVVEVEGTGGDIEGAQNPDDLAYVGLSEADAMAMAEEEGVTARVVARDDEQIAVTMDYSEDRLNFHVQEDVVVAVTRGRRCRWLFARALIAVSAGPLPHRPSPASTPPLASVRMALRSSETSALRYRGWVRRRGR